MMIVQAKPWYKSVVVWLSLLALALPDIVNFLNGVVDLKIIQDPRVVYWIAKIIALTNLYLRVFKTKQPVQV